MLHVYKITLSNPAKGGNQKLDGACFQSYILAAETLSLHGFIYNDDSDLWHNGHTEAWITDHYINTETLGVEEVQLR